jgi:hypothetical protein
MPVCGAAQEVKVSEMWPKIKFFDFHKMLNNLLDGQKKVPRATKIRVLGQFGWICFRCRQRDGALLVAAVRKGTRTVVLFVSYFYSDSIIY